MPICHLFRYFNETWYVHSYYEYVFDAISFVLKKCILRDIMQCYVTISSFKLDFFHPKTLISSHVPASLSISQSTMEEFYNKYRVKLLEHSLVDAGSGCRLWQGCTKKGSTPYGVIKAKFPDGNWKTLHSHRLQYIVCNRELNLPDALEVSHLCHQPRCIEIGHLSLEPHAINADRQLCCNRGVCFGHGPYPNCLLARLLP